MLFKKTPLVRSRQVVFSCAEKDKKALRDPKRQDGWKKIFIFVQTIALTMIMCRIKNVEKIKTLTKRCLSIDVIKNKGATNHETIV